MLRHCARRLAAHTLARQAAAAVQDAWVPCCGAVPPVSGREDDSGAKELRAVTPPWRLPCRGFATQAAEQRVDQTEEVLRRRVSQADMVLQSIEALHFRELLADMSEERLYMPYKELYKKCLDRHARGTTTYFHLGGPGSPEAAGRLCEALRAAGVIVRVGGTVFLRPDEVAETILKALPDTEREIMARLEELRLELAPLIEQKRSIDNRVNRRTRTYLWAGLGFLVVQWGVLARLTFWELSWDVIEPITYFLGSATTVLLYCYFMATREEFAYHKGVSRLERSFQEDKYREKGFDLRRYERLQRDIRRYERYLSRASDQHVSVYPEEEEEQLPMQAAGARLAS